MERSVKQTMTAYPDAVRWDANLAQSYFLMEKSKFRHLPVVDNRGNLVGIISDRDFQRAMWPKVSVRSYGEPEVPTFRTDAIISDYMSWPVKSLPHTSKLSAAVKIMIEEKISAVVITDNELLVGIVTHEDLLRVLQALLKEPSSLEKSEPSSLQEQALALAYSSPLGEVSELLAGIGI